jgi:DNA polymerase-3 subunit delta
VDPLVALHEGLEAPPPVIVLVGSESMLVRQGVDAVRGALCTGPMASLNHAAFTAGEEGALGFAETARTAPMMASRRVVELRQVQDATVALLDAVLAYVQAPVPSAVLVLHGDRFPGAVGGVDRGVRIVNAARKTGLVLKLDGSGVDPLLVARARAEALGARIDRAAAEALVAMVGGDLTALAAEVEKAAAYVGPGGTIDRAAAEQVGSLTAESDAWALVGAIVAGDRAVALESLHRLLDDGEAPHKLMATVAWQLRQVLLVQDAQQRGIDERELGVRMRPDTARAVREMVRRRAVSPAALLETLARCSHRMNRSRAGDRRIFEGLVLELVAPG